FLCPYRSRAHRALHSFPTRRSSDLSPFAKGKQVQEGRRDSSLLHLPFFSKGRAFMQGRAPINSRIHEGRAPSSKRRKHSPIKQMGARGVKPLASFQLRASFEQGGTPCG